MFSFVETANFNKSKRTSDEEVHVPVWGVGCLRFSFDKVLGGTIRTEKRRAVPPFLFRGMYCKNCGKEITDDSVFCKYCGVSLSDNKISPANKNVEKKKKGYLKVTIIAIIIITVATALFSYSYCAQEAEVARITANTKRDINQKGIKDEYGGWLLSSEEKLSIYEKGLQEVKRYEIKQSNYKILSIIIPIGIICTGCIIIFFLYKHEFGKVINNKS